MGNSDGQLLGGRGVSRGDVNAAGVTASVTAGDRSVLICLS